MPPTISHRKIMSSTDYFPYFFPLPQQQASLAFPLPEEGNENSNKISNSSVADTYLLLSVLCHNSNSWGEGLKIQVVAVHLAAQEFNNTPVFQLHGATEGMLKYNFLTTILAKRSQTTFFEETSAL